jgi:multidrug efflux pump subunit AcrA (membrane-fusion protein)
MSAKENRAVLVGYSSLKEPSRRLWTTVLASSLATLLGACRPEAKPPAPEIRPVRTVTIEKRDAGVPVVLTGSIRAQDEAPLAFRISGRMIERRVNLGDRVRAGQLVARLEPQNEQNSLRAARANLSAAQGQLTNARNHLRRQEPLAARGSHKPSSTRRGQRSRRRSPRSRRQKRR